MLLPPQSHARSIALWLYLCAAMVFAMILLGGLTRLTGSGLSMVSWEPFTGVLPPLDEQAWQSLFARYRQTPEFQRVNFWMDVEDFRSIFWLEYLHRLWGRAIALAFGLPLLFFALKRWIDKRLALRLAALLLVGGAQAALGWYMVRSGLVDRPTVSHYRLAAHLLLAVGLYGFLLWTALGIGAGAGARCRLHGHFLLVLGLITLTVCWGALVAGLDAGHVYPTFPLMDGRLVPAEVLTLSPWPADFTENAATVQFLHRALGLTLAAAVLALWWRGRGRALAWLAAAAILQLLLGIATLVGGVPLVLAAAHQAGALLLLTAALAAWHVWERLTPARET